MYAGKVTSEIIRCIEDNLGSGQWGEVTEIDKVQISINGDTSGKCRYTYKLSKMYKADDRLVTKESDEKVESTE